MKMVYTIQRLDIGKTQINNSKHCKCCGMLLWAQSIDVREFMGTIQPQNVGKRIYFTGRSYQVESQSQLEARKRKEVD